MNSTPAARDIVVIGGSAGALGPVIQIAANLSECAPAAIFVVLHTAKASPGLLPALIGKSTALPVQNAIDDDPIERGRIYVAAPDRHLLIRDGRMRSIHGARENRSRPAIDPLFRTAARRCGSRVIAVLLSGVLNDGTYGLAVVKQKGGIAIVQDPEQADFAEMPRSAIDNVDVDHVLPVLDIARLVNQLTVESGRTEARSMDRESDAPGDPVEPRQGGTLKSPPPGDMVPFSCPECGGSLWERHDGKLSRYRCHVGHGYTGETLLSDQSDEVEGALWTAFRVLEENAELTRRMARHANEAGHAEMCRRYEEDAGDSERRAALVRGLLVPE